MKNTTASYLDLNQYGDYLTPYKRERNCYHCPVCEGKLSISRGNGYKFTCYGSNCTRSDIRKAVLELAGENSSYSQEFLEKREQREREREEAEQIRRAKLSTELERDRQWQKILADSFLADRHHQDMIDRGWTPAQIELSNARSSVKGRIIPITTATGLIVGCQVITPDGKRWYTTGANHLKETGELPLTVVYPAAPRAGIIAYTESTLDKPHLCAHRRDLVTIGSSNIGSQPKDLKRSIATIKERMGWDTVSCVLMADGGAVINPHVLSNYRKVIDQLEELGEVVYVGWWGQLTKADGDIDEIPPDTQIDYLTPAEFSQIADRQLRAAEDRKLYDSLTKLSQKPDQTRDEAYLSALPLPRAGSFQLVSSPCGTGKTEQLRAVIDNWLRANPQAKIIDITHRNSIKDGHQRRLGIPEYKVGYGYSETALNHNQKVSICLDSLLKLDLTGIPAGSLIILDEIEAILNHVTKGGTLGGNTAKVQAHFARLLDRVLATAGAVIGLEDSITDLAINGLLDLTHRKYPHELILNTHERFNWDVRLGGGSVSGFLAEIIERLHAGERVIVPTASQKFGEALARLAIEEIPELAAATVRIDAKTAPERHDFLADPNAWLTDHPTRLLILSPTVESGCSIDPGYFDRRMAYFVNLGTRSQIQLLHRNRDNIPTDIYIKERGAEAGNHSRDPKKLLKVRANTANITSLAQGRGRIKLDPIGTVFNRLDAEFSARDTLSSNHLREYLEADLAARGHQIERVDWGRNSQLAARFKQIKAEIEVEENKILTEADGRSRSPEQAIAILHSSGTTFEQRQQANKTLLHRDLPGAELTEEFLMAAITKNRGKYRRQCELAWLVDKPALATHLDREMFTSQLESPHIIYSRTPKNRQKVDLLAPIAFHLQDLASGREYTADDSAVVAIQEFALKNSYLFWALFSLQIRPETIDDRGKKQNSAIATANKILKRLGYSTDSRQSGGRNERRVRIYRVTNSDCPHRQTINEALDRKYRELIDSGIAEGVHADSNSKTPNLKPVCTDSQIPIPRHTPPPDRLADLQSMAAALRVLGSIEGEDELETLKSLYAIWTPEDIAAASRLLKDSDPQAFDRLERLFAELKGSE